MLWSHPNILNGDELGTYEMLSDWDSLEWDTTATDSEKTKINSISIENREEPCYIDSQFLALIKGPSKTKQELSFLFQFSALKRIQRGKINLWSITVIRINRIPRGNKNYWKNSQRGNN